MTVFLILAGIGSCGAPLFFLARSLGGSPSRANQQSSLSRHEPRRLEGSSSRALDWFHASLVASIWPIAPEGRQRNAL